MKKPYIIFSGLEFCIEWYYDSRHRSQASDYFEALDEKRQEKILKLIKLMGNTGKIRNTEKFRDEHDKIYAFKPKPDRFLCFFFKGSKIIITNAFEKKTEKLPRQEKDRALKYRDDYIKRVAGGNYYDQEK
jgi:phage-related protein